MEEALAAEAGPAQAAAAARLAGGDVDRARFLLSEHGARMREQAENCVATALAGEVSSAPWRGLLDGAEEEGRTAEAAVRAALEQAAEEGVKRTAREITDEARRAGRRRRTDVLDLGLELCGTWLRDLAATAADAPDVVFNRDRAGALREQAAGLDPLRARAGIELIQATRRRLELNVSEELALEALFYRLERELGG